MKFKIGDRVVIFHDDSDEYGLGESGVITYVTDYDVAVVSFDNPEFSWNEFSKVNFRFLEHEYFTKSPLMKAMA